MENATVKPNVDDTVMLEDWLARWRGSLTGWEEAAQLLSITTSVGICTPAAMGAPCSGAQAELNRERGSLGARGSKPELGSSHAGAASPARAPVARAQGAVAMLCGEDE